MQTPEDVQAMLKLASLGWGAKRIAVEFGCSRNTVRRYTRQGGWQPYQQPKRSRRLQRLRAGWQNASCSIEAMPMWCARTWRTNRGARFALASANP